MDLTDKRFLVIGGAGFIGSHVVDQLLTKPVAEVIVYDSFARGTVDNLSAAMGDRRLTIVNGGPDVCHLPRLMERMNGVDGVFNLVAVGILASNESPDRAFKVNVEGNWNVVRAATLCGVKQLVHSSSASVYGDAMRIPMDEEHPYNNFTLYGATKIAMEHLLLSCGQMFPLHWAALRYFNVYGPRQDYKGAYISVLHRILDRLYSGQPPVLFGDGSQTLDFVHVHDVARANVLAMESDAQSGFFNVCSGTWTTLKEVAELLMELTDKRFDPEYRQSNTGTALVSKRIGAPRKAMDELGFKTQVSLAEGLKTLIDWRQSNGGRLQPVEPIGIPTPQMTTSVTDIGGRPPGAAVVLMQSGEPASR
jgi:UDP-glucose 4-epimerase